jgi:FkbM family methyltransferase
MIKYFKLIKPPTPRLVDKLFYLLAILLATVLVIPYSLIKKKTVKQSLFAVYPRVLLKDVLIDFYGVKFICRRGKTDILLLNELSEHWAWYYFKPNRGDVVIDVGAHVGKYALPATRMVGEEGKVIAIEAHPENFEALMRNISLNNFHNIIALNVAAYNENHKKVLLAGSCDSQFSIKFRPKRNKFIEVETRTVDSIMQENGIDKADWVKIDVEGAEIEVLEGMKDIINKSPDLKVLVEVFRGNEHKVDRILKGFKRKRLGGDYNAVYIYWRDSYPKLNAV